MKRLLALFAMLPVFAFGQMSAAPGITQDQVTALAPVQSVAGRVGAVSLGVSDVSGAAPLASPIFTGTPSAPNFAVTGALTTGSIYHSGPEYDTSMNVSTPASGGTVPLLGGINLVAPTSALLTLTVALPTCVASQNGEISRLVASQTITTMTVTALAGSIVGSLTSLLSGQGVAYICRGSNATWYRLY